MVLVGYFSICAFSFQGEPTTEVVAVDVQMACLLALLAGIVGVGLLFRRNVLRKKTSWVSEV
jgi:hypothetical protein